MLRVFVFSVFTFQVKSSHHYIKGLILKEYDFVLLFLNDVFVLINVKAKTVLKYFHNTSVLTVVRHSKHLNLNNAKILSNYVLKNTTWEDYSLPAGAEKSLKLYISKK